MMPVSSSLLDVPILFCHCIFPLTSVLTTIPSPIPGENGKSPTNAYPPSDVWVISYIRPGFELSVYIFCHKTLPLASVFTNHGCPVYVPRPLPLVLPPARNPPSVVEMREVK